MAPELGLIAKLQLFHEIIRFMGLSNRPKFKVHHCGRLLAFMARSNNRSRTSVGTEDELWSDGIAHYY
jgi:hypothetical protein